MVCVLLVYLLNGLCVCALLCDGWYVRLFVVVGVFDCLVCVIVCDCV